MSDREIAMDLARALFDLHSAIQVSDKYQPDDFLPYMRAAAEALDTWCAMERQRRAQE